MTEYLKNIEHQEQRQDSLLDQLRDLAVVADRLGMYDAADFLVDAQGTDRVKHYGETRTVHAGVPKMLVVDDCVTVRQLKEWVRRLPEVNGMGDATEVWIDTRDGHSSECRELRPLNLRDKDTAEESCDLLLGLGDR